MGNYSEFAHDFCWRFFDTKKGLDIKYYPVRTEFRLFVELRKSDSEKQVALNGAGTEMPLEYLTVGQLQNWLAGIDEDACVYLTWRCVCPSERPPRKIHNIVEKITGRRPVILGSLESGSEVVSDDMEDDDDDEDEE